MKNPDESYLGEPDCKTSAYKRYFTYELDDCMTRKPERAEDVVAGIIDVRREAFEYANAFSGGIDDLELAKERSLIIRELPSVYAQDAFLRRLGAFTAQNFASLDLSAARNNGRWDDGEELDIEAELHLSQLQSDESMQAAIGATCLQLINKRSDLANPLWRLTSLGDEYDESSVYLASRMRRVAKLRTGLGKIAIVRKNSDFIFYDQKDRRKLMLLATHGSDEMIATSAIDYSAVNRLQTAWENINCEDDYSQSMDMLKKIFVGINRALEVSMRNRKASLYPVNMHYHITVEEDK